MSGMILPILISIMFVAMALMLIIMFLEDFDFTSVLASVGVIAATIAIIYCAWNDPSLRSPFNGQSFTQTIVVMS